MTRKEQRKRNTTMGIEDINKPISPKTISGRLNGRKGGIERGKRHSKEKLEQWAEKGGISVVEKYGSDYYKQIGMMGAQKSTAKLTWKQVEEIRNRHTKGEKVLQLSREYRVGQPAIYDIIKERTWKKEIK